MDDQNVNGNKKKNPSPLVYNKHENKCNYEGVTTDDKESQDKKCNVSVIYVNSEGYIENAGVKRNDISELNQGKIEKINAIVLHRTNSSTKESALSSFKSGIGTHFLIDKNGDIYQTAGLSTYVYQIGFIQARCENDKACTSMDKKILNKINAQKHKSYSKIFEEIHEYEILKKYPIRYPYNGDAVGIEVVAKYHKNTKTWEASTNEQKKSVNKLVDILINIYELTNEDVYEHDKIGHKTAGEGKGLYITD